MLVIPLIIRKKELEAMQQLISLIRDNASGIDYSSIFLFKSHLLTDKAISLIGGHKPKKSKQKVIRKKRSIFGVLIYIVHCIMVLLATPIRYFQWGDLRWSHLIGNEQTCYVFASELVTREDALKKELASVQKLIDLAINPKDRKKKVQQ